MIFMPIVLLLIMMFVILHFTSTEEDNTTRLVFSVLSLQLFITIQVLLFVYYGFIG